MPKEEITIMAWFMSRNDSYYFNNTLFDLRNEIDGNLKILFSAGRIRFDIFYNGTLVSVLSPCKIKKYDFLILGKVFLFNVLF